MVINLNYYNSSEPKSNPLNPPKSQNPNLKNPPLCTTPVSSPNSNTQKSLAASAQNGTGSQRLRKKKKKTRPRRGDSNIKSEHVPADREISSRSRGMKVLDREWRRYTDGKFEAHRSRYEAV